MRRRLMLKSSAGVSPVLPAEYQQAEWIGINNAGVGNIKLEDIGINIGKIIMLASVDSFYGQKPSLVLRNGSSNKYGYISNYPYLSAFSCSPSIPKEQSATKETLTFTKKSSQSGGDLYLFSGPGQNGRGIKIFSVTIYNNAGSIILNGIPCYQKISGEIGVYDSVSRTFIAGSSLMKGADV